ncbi:MAG: nuclease (SNase) [Gallionellales bacterium GWA2_55_18]|nr:MAG: nuclease (SNase) [Gallionellales bacterium GWA2_55_18]
MRSLIYLALLGTSSATHGAEFTAKVIAVLDGDTVMVQRKSGLVKIRLNEIDAPEKAQTFGETSKRSLSEMVLGKQVKISSQAMDQYGRMVAHLDLNGMDVNAEQIRRGMAWEYSHFHGNKALVALQEEAKQVPRGLWALSDPMPPWEWRKLHPNVDGKPPVASAAITGNANLPGCGSKKRCSEMTSCEEARHYLTQCGIKTLDGNGDGVPCDNLCGSRK